MDVIKCPGSEAYEIVDIDQDYEMASEKQKCNENACRKCFFKFKINS